MRTNCVLFFNQNVLVFGNSQGVLLRMEKEVVNATSSRAAVAYLDRLDDAL